MCCNSFFICISESRIEHIRSRTCTKVPAAVTCILSNLMIIPYLGGGVHTYDRDLEIQSTICCLTTARYDQRDTQNGKLLMMWGTAAFNLCYWHSHWFLPWSPLQWLHLWESMILILGSCIQTLDGPLIAILLQTTLFTIKLSIWHATLDQPLNLRSMVSPCIIGCTCFQLPVCSMPFHFCTRHWSLVSSL